MLMIVTTILGLVLPVAAVLFFQPGSTGMRHRMADRLNPIKAFSKITGSQHSSRQEDRICEENACDSKCYRHRRS
jgi:hypothetical protein